PAFFRLPLLLFGNVMTTDITFWSMLSAVTIAGFVKVYAIAKVWRHTPPSPWRQLLLPCLAAVLLFGGAQTQFLKLSIYQAAVTWGHAFASVFVCFALIGLIERRFTIGALLMMSTMAGLALLTRVSTGLGLYVALAALLLVLLWTKRLTAAQLVA